jgi:transposase InsO family protein/transposase
MIDKWLTLNEIARLISRTKGPIIRRAQLEGWPYRSYTVRGGKERRYHLANLPEDIQTAYAASIKTSLEELRSRLKPASKPDKKIDIPRYSGRGARTGEVKDMENTPEEYLRIAAARRKVLEAYSASGLTAAQFVTAYNNGVAAPDLRGQLGTFGEISSQSSLYRWLERYEQHGLSGLAPQYAKRRGGAGASLDEKAKDLIQALYLDSHKPSIRTVERDIKQFGYDLNYSIINRYINDGIPLSVKTFYRMGEKAYHDRFDPYITRDYTLFKPMEWGVADHHLFDFVIKHKGRIFRPWLTRFDDMRSRKIAGWHIDIIPNTLTILRALSMAVENCGTFDNLLIDNGKDFKSYWFAGNAWKNRKMKLDKETCDLIEGVLHDCGTMAHFCIPYRGQSKPIERAFRTDIELFEKRMETYVGSNTATRPDEAKLYWGRINGRDKIEVELTLEEVRREYAEYAEWFNSEWKHSGQGMDGKTPNQVFEENRGPRKEIPEAMRKYIFTRREKRIVRRNGVTIDGIEYYNPQMVQYIGSEIEVRRDINKIGAVSLYLLPDRTYLFDAESDVLKDFGIPEENIRSQRTAQRTARSHLAKFAKDASDIRQAAKSPAALRAEAEAATADGRLVAGGDPLPAQTSGFALAPKPAKRKIKGIFDVD